MLFLFSHQVKLLQKTNFTIFAKLRNFYTGWEKPVYLAVNYFHEKFHLRCLTEIWVRLWPTHFGSIYLQVSYRKAVPKDFTKLTGKHLWWTLFKWFFKSRASNFITKSVRHTLCFTVNFSNFFQRSNFTEHFWVGVSNTSFIVDRVDKFVRLKFVRKFGSTVKHLFRLTFIEK